MNLALILEYESRAPFKDLAEAQVFLERFASIIPKGYVVRLKDTPDGFLIEQSHA